ncbi:MAG: DUF4231 domain-containing protein [Lewinellaceae bacterium]|nr:DUF4231 domain-containing protein [Lewinellaceae bacterium]
MNSLRTPEEYLKNRVVNQIEWYDRKSGILKRRYRRMKVITICLGVLIPVMIVLNDLLAGMGSYIAAVFGAAISAMEGISGMLKDKDTFLSYRATSESLLREQMMYTTLSGPYQQKESAFQNFVSNCEQIMGGENGMWRDRFVQEPKDDTAK